MSLPIGTVISYVGLPDNLNQLAFEGWLLCDGSQVSTSDYPLLSTVIGKTFGSTKNGCFNLPDLRGMFLRGLDSTGVVDPDYKKRTSGAAGNSDVVGPYVGSRQAHQVVNHTHNWDANFSYISESGSDLPVQLAKSVDYVDVTADGLDPNPQPTTLNDGGGNETRPSNVYVYHLIFAGTSSAD